MRLITLLIVFCLAIQSCHFIKNDKAFELNRYELSDQKDQLLCFDLTDDDIPRSGILVKSNSKIKDHNVILPFSIKDARNSIDILSSTSSFENFSFVSYKCFDSRENRISFIGYTPILSEVEKGDESFENYNGGIYFIKNGLERKFIYNIGSTLRHIDKFRGIQFDTMNFIAVRLPIKSKGIEVRDGKTTDPASIEINGIKYFNLTTAIGQNKVSLAYLVPANKLQIQLFEFLSKLLAVLIVPFISFLFIKPSRSLSPKAKKITIAGLFILQLSILLILSYLAFFTENIESTKTFDIIMLVIGAGFSFAIAFFQGESTVAPIG